MMLWWTLRRIRAGRPERVRLRAISKLATVSDDRALNALAWILCARSSSQSLRAASGDALRAKAKSDVGNSISVANAIWGQSFDTHGDYTLREEIAGVLTNICDVAGIQKLLKSTSNAVSKRSWDSSSFQSEKKYVRQILLRCLGMMGTPEARDALATEGLNVGFGEDFAAEQLAALGDSRASQLLPVLERAKKEAEEEWIARKTVYASDCPYWKKGYCKVREMVQGDLTKQFERCSLVISGEDRREQLISGRLGARYKSCHVWNLYPTIATPRSSVPSRGSSGLVSRPHVLAAADTGHGDARASCCVDEYRRRHGRGRQL